MKYYIGHKHEYGKTVDKVFVEDLASKKKIVEEKVSIEDVESRVEELKKQYPDHNMLHFVY